MFEEESKARFELYAGILLTFLGYAGRFTGIEPLYNQFFVFAVWAYIFFSDYLTYKLKGVSLAVSRTGEFLTLALWSLAICSAYELLNLRLEAWYYVDQPATLSTRWTGRAFAWAATLPCLFVTSELLRFFNLLRGLNSARFKVPGKLLRSFPAAGAALLLAALAVPKFFWPLIWPAFLLLAEPLNYRLGLGSLLRELEAGMPVKALRLALSGIICGLLWNLWNSAAGAKWGYTHMFKAGPEVFGLPLPAYAGFPFFAIVSYSLYSLASYLRDGKTWEEGARGSPGAVPPFTIQVAAGLLIIMCYSAFRAVDAHTVKLYLGWV